MYGVIIFACIVSFIILVFSRMKPLLSADLQIRNHQSDSSVGKATRWVRIPTGTIIFSSQQRPYLFWGPHILSNGYRERFLSG
jgi:hypothetical protein